MNETVAVYGGSFDPPHVAHLLAATWVATCTEVDHVLIVPTFAHALGKEARASFDHRLAMCEALARDVPRCTVSDIERSLPSPSRTLHTLEALSQARPGARFRLVVGADIARDTSRWHRWDDIVAIAPPLWLGRAGYAAHEAATITFTEMSSTDIRARLSRGEPVRGLVPNAVADYIEAHALYARPA